MPFSIQRQSSIGLHNYREIAFNNLLMTKSHHFWRYNADLYH
jgi:hypothetical protein